MVVLKNHHCHSSNNLCDEKAGKTIMVNTIHPPVKHALKTGKTGIS